MILIIMCACAFISIYGANLLLTCTTMGLILSLVGDIILISETEDQFLLGLGVFFLAHILYIIAFRFFIVHITSNGSVFLPSPEIN